MNRDRPRITIGLVTWNDAHDLPACFAALAQVDHRPLEVVVVDCGSQDDSVAQAQALPLGDIPRRIVPLGENRGYAGGMNAGLAASDAPYFLALNPDASLSPDAVGAMLARLEADPRAAACTGRLVRPETEEGERRLDACGMVLRRTWRHLDRGSDELDRGQYDCAEQVFGATGAAVLYRRAALDDVALESAPPGVFDPLFFTYREDAELCFRFAARGWSVIYEPLAMTTHRRRVLPSRRADLSAVVNYHSLKNRYLLRAYHQGGRNLLATFVPTLARDLAALAYVLVRERTSLAAYAWLWRHRRQIRSRRREIDARRTAGREAVDRWFWTESLPLRGDGASDR